ncbi:MAG: hypothetical protein KC505_07030 [Myxococcales bacterium]|nr:hypothetical protein [Myxococcales bacterium]USN50513.1 MAG: hypothetical protein H6731_09660 [Myxococcales bacterium]
MIKIIFSIIYTLILSSCGLNNNNNHKLINNDQQENKSLKNNKITAINNKNNDDNYWSKPDNLGPQENIVTYNSQQNLANDPRVIKGYNDYYPEIMKRYVLFRVEHNGSCWVYSALTNLVVNLIDSGKDNFTKSITTLDNLAKENAEKYEHFEKFYKSDDYKKVIDAFKWISKSMDFKKSLDFINHKEVHNVLNKAMRAFLAANKRKLNKIDQAKELETEATCWGDIGDFSFIFNTLNINLSGIKFITEQEALQDKKVTYNPLNNTYVFINSSKLYKNFLNEKLIKTTGYNHKKDNFKEHLNMFFAKAKDTDLPKIIYVRSNIAYMDAAVLSSFAKRFQ